VTELILCGCGLAKHMVAVDGPAGTSVTMECEHCDRLCTETGCRLCTALSRAEAAKPGNQA
jgi:hypothetical protein